MIARASCLHRCCVDEDRHTHDTEPDACEACAVLEAAAVHGPRLEAKATRIAAMKTKKPTNGETNG